MYMNNRIYNLSVLACMLSIMLISMFIPYGSADHIRPRKTDAVYSYISPPQEDHTTILIDPGHGGYDGEIALKTGACLEEMGYDVLYSRTSDEVSWPQDNAADLQARVDMGVAEDADYFISFHLNATDFYNDGARGFETFVTPGNDTADIAAAIHEKLAALDFSLDRGVNETDYTALHVLALNPVPAMLIELGFITDDQDLSYLCDASFQDTALSWGQLTSSLVRE